MSSKDPYLIVLDGARWIQENPGRWQALLNLLEWACADQSIYRLRRGDVWVYAQQMGLEISTCKQFRFDNNLWSVLSRYALMLRPHLSRIIHPRTSDIDTVSFELIWFSLTEEPIAFKVSNWTLAAAYATQSAA